MTKSCSIFQISPPALGNQHCFGIWPGWAWSIGFCWIRWQSELSLSLYIELVLACSLWSDHMSWCLALDDRVEGIFIYWVAISLVVSLLLLSLVVVVQFGCCCLIWLLLLSLVRWYKVLLWRVGWVNQYIYLVFVWWYKEYGPDDIRCPRRASRVSLYILSCPLPAKQLTGRESSAVCSRMSPDGASGGNITKNLTKSFSTLFRFLLQAFEMLQQENFFQV